MSLPAFQICERHLCIVAGVGLIGQQVVDCLAKNHPQLLDVVPSIIDWRDANTIIQAIQHAVTKRDIDKLDIIWSAGKAGFAASDGDMEQEYLVYQAVIAFLDTCPFQVAVNFLSSAGGIYENTAYVDRVDAVSPSRPYACWKLKQEELLYQLNNIEPRVYRIASVYGFKRLQSRAGLINVMIDRAISREAVVVYGNQNTLRDYIFHRDIARYIVEGVVSHAVSETKVIASGRATSISELINMVSRITGKRVKAFYLDNQQNSNDIVFSPQVVPADLQITSLEEGIRLLHARS